MQRMSRIFGYPFVGLRIGDTGPANSVLGQGIRLCGDGY